MQKKVAFHTDKGKRRIFPPLSAPTPWCFPAYFSLRHLHYLNVWRRHKKERYQNYDCLIQTSRAERHFKKYKSLFNHVMLAADALSWHSVLTVGLLSFSVCSSVHYYSTAQIICFERYRRHHCMLAWLIHISCQDIPIPEFTTDRQENPTSCAQILLNPVSRLVVKSHFPSRYFAITRIPNHVLVDSRGPKIPFETL